MIILTEKPIKIASRDQRPIHGTIGVVVGSCIFCAGHFLAAFTQKMRSPKGFGSTRSFSNAEFDFCIAILTPQATKYKSGKNLAMVAHEPILERRWSHGVRKKRILKIGSRVSKLQPREVGPKMPKFPKTVFSHFLGFLAPQSPLNQLRRFQALKRSYNYLKSKFENSTPWPLRTE